MSVTAYRRKDSGRLMSTVNITNRYVHRRIKYGIMVFSRESADTDRLTDSVTEKIL